MVALVSHERGRRTSCGWDLIGALADSELVERRGNRAIPEQNPKRHRRRRAATGAIHDHHQTRDLSD